MVKGGPTNVKELTVEVDVPEFLAEQGLRAEAKEVKKVVGDLTLKAFYYLQHIGEYTIKGTCNKKNQTVQFKYEDVTFFKKNAAGQLRCLP
jgi:hypothetical protein